MRSLLLLLLVLLPGCASQYFKDAGAPPEARGFALEAWPHRELWTGVVFNGEKIGYTRREVRPTADAGRWEIESEAVMRIQFLGIDKRIRLQALDRVRADFTLESFEYQHEIDGNRMRVSGDADGRTLRFTVEASGTREDKRLPLKKPLYASSALSMMPLARGLKVGAAGRYDVFHGETQAITEAEQEVLAYEASELFEGAAFKVATRLLGLETTTWIAADGRPVFELGMRGVIISALEDEATARRYLLEASLSRRDTMVEFSLLRTDPIDSPRRVSRMDIVLSGFPPQSAIPSEGGQRCDRAGERVTCRIDREAPLSQAPDPGRHLAPTLAAPSNLGEIRALAHEIAKGSAGEEDTIARLLAWMDANIAKEAVDAFTAADVLRARRAECQGHAYLFAAFARALGIPVRIVNGIAYSEAHGGFLFHTWNEAWLAGRGWQPVDATFGQARADATHLKLIEGEAAAELVPLVNLVGRVRVASVSALQW